jgi:DNA-binding NtrC family response regulator
MSGRILVVDDEPSMCALLESTLSRRGFAVESFHSGSAALDRVAGADVDVVLTDLQMPGVNGIQLCRQLVERRPGVPVIVMTAFGSMDSAVAALRAGAYDFINKPIDNDTLALMLERAVKHRQLLNQVERLSLAVQGLESCDDLVGASPAMQRLFALMHRVANLEAPVLITGESGTGKELVARWLHRHGARKDGPFLALNCASIPEALLESELFGHRRGAFTDARADRAGLMVQAHGGTLLLDEIADMPSTLQPKLLRALEQRTVRPLGGDAEVPFDVRVLAATNRDIESRVADGTFRGDLFYRLNVIQLPLPALRARGNDILLLARHFLTQFAQSQDRPVVGISTPAAARMLAYAWPGNVRELRNAIERAVALTQHDRLLVEDLPLRIQNAASTAIGMPASDDPSELVPLEEMERRYIAFVLQSVAGNKTAAARILQLDRKTLYRKLARYGLASAASDTA